MKERIVLDPDRRARLVAEIRAYLLEHHDDDVGDLKAGLLLDFLVREMGPAIYNLAIHDAQAYFQQKIEDLEIEYSKPESPPGADSRSDIPPRK
jgi:uncharacterized protein (DUF2164 family)